MEGKFGLGGWREKGSEGEIKVWDIRMKSVCGNDRLKICSS